MLTIVNDSIQKFDVEAELKRFGRDHYSTLLYIETRCVDYSGKVNVSQMRCNPLRHPQFAHDGGWSNSHSTRWADGVEPIMGHDDWDCVDDLERLGFLTWNGTGVHPRFELTDAGWELAHRLRRERAERTKNA